MIISGKKHTYLQSIEFFKNINHLLFSENRNCLYFDVKIFIAVNITQHHLEFLRGTVTYFYMCQAYMSTSLLAVICVLSSFSHLHILYILNGEKKKGKYQVDLGFSPGSEWQWIQVQLGEQKAVQKVRGPCRWSRQTGSELQRDVNENWAQSDFVSLDEVFIKSYARQFFPNKQI